MIWSVHDLCIAESATFARPECHPRRRDADVNSRLGQAALVPIKATRAALS